MLSTTHKHPNYERSEHPDVVFIISPTGRSGTNYLRNLIVQSGICGAPADWPFQWEDWLLHGSNHLIDYCNSLEERWHLLNAPKPHSAKKAAEDIQLLLGRALTRRISDGCNDKYVAVKTPSSQNVQNISSLFPESKLILLVRDGRDTCHSFVRSGFSEDHNWAFKNWAERAGALLEFDSNVDFQSTCGSHLWIKYEDSFADPIRTLRRVAEFLELPTDQVKLDHLGKLPVYGSSEVRDDKDGFVYEVKPRTEGFNPIGRWRNWSDDRINDFKEIAGEQLIELGYEKTNDW